MDLFVKNGTIVTAGGISRADLGVKDCKIVQIGGELGEAAAITAAELLAFDATPAPVQDGGDVDQLPHQRGRTAKNKNAPPN